VAVRSKENETRSVKICRSHGDHGNEGKYIERSRLLERKYIFHHTAKGFAVFVAGILLLIAISIFMAIYFPDNKPLNYSIFILLAFLIVFVAFKVDKMALKKKGRTLTSL
jgi:hypothetical protein